MFRTQHAPGASNSVIVVTDEGLVVVDGTCRGAGNPEWLKGQPDQRFDVPVKYVILSHDHEDQMEFFLGGKRFILYYFGPTHSDNLIQIHVPYERLLIAPDISRAGHSLVMPDFRDANVNNIIDTLKALSMLDDVEIVVPGHGGREHTGEFCLVPRLPKCA